MLGWLQLLRAPNLLTVPGDVLAGCLLAAGTKFTPDMDLGRAVLASVFFYASGLVLNDLADLEIDRKERPARPLPSGRVGLPAARAVAMLLMAAALGFCAWIGGRTMIVGAVLCAAILSYNLLAKHRALSGPLNMGLCRALNLVLGATLVGTANSLLLVASILLTAYVTTVTYIANREMRNNRYAWYRWLPAAIILVGALFFARHTTVTDDLFFRMAASFFVAFAAASYAAMRLHARQGAPAAVGLMVSALIFLQAAFCLASALQPWGLAAGLLLFICWPLNFLLRTRFYAS